MKVAELIKELQALPQDMPVYMFDEGMPRKVKRAAVTAFIRHHMNQGSVLLHYDRPLAPEEGKVCTRVVTIR